MGWLSSYLLLEKDAKGSELTHPVLRSILMYTITARPISMRRFERGAFDFALIFASLISVTLIGVASVSYTHLDVYKRQGLSGKIVVSSGGGGMFYVYDLTTGTLRPVTNGYDPAISLDGTQIAFTRMGGENGIYVINIDGSNERKLFSESELLVSPKWNADGSKIAFAHLASSNTTTCLSPGFGICIDPEEVPEGFPLKTITRSSAAYGLGRVTVADKEFRDLPIEGSVDAPDWDNDNIIYRANRGFKITADKPTVEIKTVTEDPGFQDPDLYGNRIVYQSKSGNHWEIMVMNDDSSGQTYLTRPVTALVDELPNNVSPAWSPDGKYIVFLSNRAANNSAGDWYVWVMNADGSNQRQLPIEVKMSYGYAQEQMVSWGK